MSDAVRLLQQAIGPDWTWPDDDYDEDEDGLRCVVCLSPAIHSVGVPVSDETAVSDIARLPTGTQRGADELLAATCDDHLAQVVRNCRTHALAGEVTVYPADFPILPEEIG